MFLLLVACSQILLYIHKSMMKTTQKYMGKGVLSSLGELGKTGRECCFIRKKLAYWCQKEGITKETVLHTRRVLIKQMKVVACGPETREDSGWDWRSLVKVLYQEKEEGQKNFSWWTGAFFSCLLTSATPDTVLCELSSSHWLPPWEVVVPSSPLLRMPSSSPHWPKPSPSRPGRGAPPHQAPWAFSSRSGATWAQRPFAAQPLQCLANSSLSKALISFGWGSSNHGGKGPCPQGG